MANLQVNDGGAWKFPKNFYVNDSGTWKAAKRVYINDQGDWKTIFNPLVTSYDNKLNYDWWEIGSVQTQQTSSGTTYYLNGDGNKIIADTDPFGNTVPVWQTVNNDTTSDGDGGWNTSQFQIDRTSMYRYSIWVKRPVLGNGHFYQGLYGYNGAGTISGVYRRTDNVLVTNSYFEINSNWAEWGNTSDWYLVVSHVWPEGSGAGSNHSESAIYDINGNKIDVIEYDYIWNTDTTAATQRTYLYYSTVSSTDQRWVYPRVDKIDGTEPSISELLNFTKPAGEMPTCKDYKDAGYFHNGVYTINPTGSNSFDAYCDMSSYGGGWTLVFYSNSNNVNRNMIAAGDWNSGPTVNFSRLYSFKDVKRDGFAEYFIHDSSTVFRHNVFKQTNSYLESPVGNSYTKTNGNFYYSSYTSGWQGFALGSYGQSAMQTNCSLSMADYGSSWTYCLQDQYDGGYNTGPWFYDGSYDAGSQQWVKVYQR